MGNALARRLTTALAAAVPAVTTAVVLAHPASAATPTQPGTFVPVTPTRILDTRTGFGGTAPGPNGDLHLAVAGVGPIPASGLSSIVLNVTVAAPTAHGVLTAFADGAARPATSNLNFVTGEAAANLVVAQLGADGRVDLHNGSTGTTQLIVDVSGYYLTGTAATPGAFTPTAPRRMLDTRIDLGNTAPGPGQIRTLHVAGVGAIPPTGVSAVAMNVTVTQPGASGYVYVPGPAPAALADRPSSNLDFAAGQTVANFVMAPVDSLGNVYFVNRSNGTTQLVADVFGWYLSGNTTRAGAYTATEATRVLDTRTSSGPTGPGRAVQVRVSGAGNTPPDHVGEVVLNVTVTAPTVAGFVTAYADGMARPAVSTVNFVAGQTVPNLVIAPVGADGVVDLYNGSKGSLQLVADMFGYYADADAQWMPSQPPAPANTTDQLDAISCAAPTACTAVGATADVSGTVHLLAETLTGTNWTRTVIPLPNGFSRGALTAVSCTSTAACRAVGYAAQPGQVPIAASLSGGSWTLSELPLPSGVAGGALAGVSCVAATDCVAVGSDNGPKLIIEALSGTTWTASAVDSGADVASLSGVSCTSATACTAVGMYQDVTVPPPGYPPIVSTYPMAVVWNGMSGSLQSVPSSLAPAPLSGLTAISCAAPATCTAVGDSGQIDTYASGSWTETRTTARHLSGVSCTSPTACTASGDYAVVSSGAGQPLTETLAGGTWTPAGLPPTWSNGDLLGISCTTAVSCTAVGYTNTGPVSGSANTPLPLVETR